MRARGKTVNSIASPGNCCYNHGAMTNTNEKILALSILSDPEARPPSPRLRRADGFPRSSPGSRRVHRAHLAAALRAKYSRPLFVLCPDGELRPRPRRGRLRPDRRGGKPALRARLRAVQRRRHEPRRRAAQDKRPRRADEGRPQSPWRARRARSAPRCRPRSSRRAAFEIDLKTQGRARGHRGRAFCAPATPAPCRSRARGSSRAAAASSTSSPLRSLSPSGLSSGATR